MTTRQFRSLTWLQIAIMVSIIVVGTLYYTRVVGGAKSLQNLFWKTGFEEFKNYSSYSASDWVLAIMLWIFKSAGITIGILQLLIRHLSSAKKGKIIPKTKQEIYNGVLSCISVYIIVDLILLFSQWFLAISYTKKMEEESLETKER